MGPAHHCRALRAAAQGGRAHRAAFRRLRERRDCRHRQDTAAGERPRYPARRGEFPRLRRSCHGPFGECFEMGTADGRGALNYTVHKPVGVVAVIAPWNLPFLLLTWKVAPALACGNTVVVKPSEETPSSATLLAEVMQEVGVPPGVFNLVHGFGADSAGEALVRHPDVNAIAFTGESATGMAIMKSAADSVKALSFELGGKNASLVFADADFE